MAEVSITIRRNNGMSIMASGTVDDAMVAEIAQTLSAILFDLSMSPAEAAISAPAPANPA